MNFDACTGVTERLYNAIKFTDISNISSTHNKQIENTLKKKKTMKQWNYRNFYVKLTENKKQNY